MPEVKARPQGWRQGTSHPLRHRAGNTHTAGKIGNFRFVVSKQATRHNSTPQTMGEPEPVNDDLEWIHAALDGDLAAFSQLVLRHQLAVSAFLLARLSRKHEAEDLAQETFVTAWRRLSDFDPTRPFGAWLRGIAENHLRNHLRKFRAEPIGGDEALQMILDREQDSSDSGDTDLAAALGECIERIAGPARDLLMARYAEGLSMAELCAKSGQKHSAVTMKLHRLRLSLAACVEGKLAGTP